MRCGPSIRLFVIVTGIFVAGCQKSAPDVPEDSVSIPSAPALQDPLGDRTRQLQQEMAAKNPQMKAEQLQIVPRDGQIVAVEVREAGVTDLSPLTGLPLEVLGLAGNPVSDLTALRGMPLTELDLEGTQVVDLLPLAGMPLQSLWLNHAPVADLTPLTGAPLRQLSLLGTKVTDVAPLKDAPLESLWLNETQVTDLSPLVSAPLISVTLHQTPVSDISIARNWPGLQRLHLGESQVTDLRPLAGLRLTRLIITPGRIKDGLDVVRQMDTLTELDVEFREPKPWSPAEFWQRYDAGELR